MSRAQKQLLAGFDQPVFRFTQRPIIIDADASIVDAAKLMRDNNVGSIIVAEKTKEPVGILTEWDLLSRVIAEGKNIAETRIREVMSSPLVRIGADAKVGDAVRLMTNRGIRRVAVFEGGVLVGTLTQSQIVGNRRSSSTPLPIVEQIKGHQCPYCNSIFRFGKELSKHINTMHSETVRLEMEAREESDENTQGRVRRPKEDSKVSELIEWSASTNE
jgi:signal-transduction protein with cAMP-binding, CBS, and nucleotidyltransferase domain